MTERAVRPRVVVIGSGFGGIACAIRMQQAGCAVTIVERRDQPGGRAYVYRDAGFTFDAGPTVITAPALLEDLFTLAGKRLADYIELIPVHPFYRLLWDDGDRFDYDNDLEATLAQIRRRNSVDAGGYQRLLAYTAEVFEEGFTKLAHVPFLHFRDMIRAAPELIRLQAYRSVYAKVSEFIQDDHLRQAFSFHALLVGGDPFAASSIYMLIHQLERTWGVYHPRGGTNALIAALLKLFQELGGAIRLGFDVDRIDIEGGRVTGVTSKAGERLEAEQVVSNADVVHTYRSLLRASAPARARGERLARRRHSMSLFVIYFGTRRRYPGIAHHTVLFGPRYGELLRDIFGRGVLADDFSLYLHAPTVTDPSLAPPGHEAFYVLSPVPHLGKAPLDWDTVGPRYADRILAELERRYLPGLRAEIVTQRIFTPLDFARELNAHHGSAFSLEPILTQSAWFRVHNRDPDLRGLYFVGAGTHPGAGVPGVVSSARATAGLAIADAALAR